MMDVVNQDDEVEMIQTTVEHEKENQESKTS
jgi:hypothetical protein